MTDGAVGLPPSPDNELLDRALAGTRRARETVVATIATMIWGFLLLLHATQLYYYFRLYRLMALVPPVLLATGIALLVLASKLYSQRVWAAITAGVLLGITTLGIAAWCLFLFLGGVHSLLILVLPLAMGAGAVIAGVAVGPCKRTEAARREAAAAGLDIDL